MIPATTFTLTNPVAIFTRVAADDNENIFIMLEVIIFWIIDTTNPIGKGDYKTNLLPYILSYIFGKNASFPLP